MEYRIALAAALLAAAASAPAAAQELSLDEAQDLAEMSQPQLLAQSASVRAARSARLSAGELPDPKLIAGIDNLPADGADRFNVTRDFMTMRKVGLMQEFPRAEKLRLREERADAEVRREEALLAVTGVNLRRDVALAWIEAWSAESQVALLQDLAREADLAVTAAGAAVAGGRGQAADALAARLAQEQLADRIIEARRMAARTREMLARWVGRHWERPLGAPPDFTKVGHSHSEILSDLDTHPHLAMYAPMQDMADAEVKLAEAAKRPDWSLEVAYAQRGPAFSNMLFIGVRIDLPIFEARRQEPAIASRLAEAERIRMQAEDARRAHLAEVRVMLADWRAAMERAKRIETLQVPLARERLDAALAAYAGARGELLPVIEARRAEVETRIALLQARTEMGRAWAQLDSLLPHSKEKS